MNIEDKLSNYPIWVAQMVYDVAFGLETIVDIAKKYKKSRSAVSSHLYTDEIQEIIQEIKKDKCKQINTDWETLVAKAKEVYKDILFNGTPQLKYKVSSDILRGTGVLTENSNINHSVNGQLVIKRPNKE